MKKAFAATALAAGVVAGVAGCGNHYVNQANNTYCVNQQGQVVPPQYCQVGYPMYNPAMFGFWVGPTYGHNYGVGTVIQHNYYTAGKRVDPGNSTARRAAGIPVSGTVNNGAKATTTTRVPSASTSPAQKQPAPSVGVGGSSGRTTTTPKVTTTVPKTTSSFGGFSGRSSGGRK